MIVNHSFVFNIERNFDFQSQSDWFRDHNYVPITIVISYITAIFVLKNDMKSREAFDLRKPLALWNGFLAVFSICGMLRVTPLVYYDILHVGFDHSLCDASNIGNVGMFWGWLFALSKFIEFGDTFFIVLRKRKLLFLHWYHHATVAEFAWVGYGLLFPPGRWVTAINYTVHAIMYSYYSLRAMGMKVPRRVSMSITVLQMLQMLVAIVMFMYIPIIRLRGISCEIPTAITNISAVVILTYFFLFSNFFYKSYVKPDSKKLK